MSPEEAKEHLMGNLPILLEELQGIIACLKPKSAKALNYIKTQFPHWEFVGDDLVSRPGYYADPKDPEANTL